MPFRLSFDLEGEKQLSRVLQITTEGVKDYTEPLTKTRDIIVDRYQENFSQRGKLFGGWSPRTRAYAHPLLEKSGKMRKSIFSQVSKTEVGVSNRASYFKYHQSNKPRKRLPRRVMLMIDATSSTAITKAFQAYLIKLIQGRR